MKKTISNSKAGNNTSASYALPVLFALILSIIYTVVFFEVYKYLHCLGKEECRIWDLTISSMTVFGLVTFFFFIYFSFLFIKQKVRTRKILLYLLPFVIGMYAFHNYAWYEGYLVTSDTGINVRDFQSELFGYKKQEFVPWDKIESYGIQEVKSKRDYGIFCGRRTLYVQLKQPSIENPTIQLITWNNGDTPNGESGLDLSVYLRGKNVPSVNTLPSECSKS